MADFYDTTLSSFDIRPHKNGYAGWEYETLRKAIHEKDIRYEFDGQYVVNGEEARGFLDAQRQRKESKPLCDASTSHDASQLSVCDAPLDSDIKRMAAAIEDMAVAIRQAITAFSKTTY